MLVRNVATTAASSLIVMPLAFLSEVMLARMLGAEQRGVFALAVLIPNTAFTFCMLGLATSHNVYASKHPEKRGAIAFQSFAVAGLMGVFMLAFYGYLLLQRPGWFGRFEVVGTFNHLLASFIVVLQLLATYLQAGVLGANRIQVVNVGTLVRSLTKLCLIGCLVGLLGMGVTGGIAAQLGCLAVLAVYMSVATARQVPVKTWRPDSAFVKKTLAFGLKDHVGSLGFYISTRVDGYMVAYLLPNSDRAMGHYAMAVAFSLIVWLLPNSLQTVFLPHLSATKEDPIAIAAKTGRLVAVGLLPILLLCALGSPLIPVLVGQDYTESVAPFALLLPGLFLFGAVRPHNAYLLYIEKPIYTAIASPIIALINIVLNLVLIPRVGISGAALATSISYGVLGLIQIGCFKYETKVPWSTLIVRPSDVGEAFRLAGVSLQKLRRNSKRPELQDDPENRLDGRR